MSKNWKDQIDAGIHLTADDHIDRQHRGICRDGGTVCTDSACWCYDVAQNAWHEIQRLDADCANERAEKESLRDQVKLLTGMTSVLAQWQGIAAMRKETIETLTQERDEAIKALIEAQRVLATALACDGYDERHAEWMAEPIRIVGPRNDLAQQAVNARTVPQARVHDHSVRLREAIDMVKLHATAEHWAWIREVEGELSGESHGTD